MKSETAKRDMMVPLQEIRISASILAADFSNLGKAVRDVETAGADSVHIDFMDGHYVHNLSFGIDLIAHLRPHTSLPLIAHLEIDNPDAYVADFARAGVDGIIVCDDTCRHPVATINDIRSNGIQAGVSLNPDRPLELAEKYLDQLDLLLLMAVLPGVGGQRFQPSVLGKIAAARRLADRMVKPFQVGVDGGINSSTLSDVASAGADLAVIGSAIYRGNPRENLRRLRGL